MHSRLAPTPSGRLHIGNIYNFILTFWYVKSHEGTLSLRIDDSDLARTRDEYIEDIFDTLSFLDLEYDHGAKNLKDFKENFSQQNKFQDYYQVVKNNPKLFACDCSRKSFEYLNSYPGTCKSLGKTLVKGTHCLRLNDGESYPVLWRKDNGPAYHLCSIKDDVDDQVTHIIRGNDLCKISEQQKRIAPFLGMELKAQIFHHELLTNDGKKISKTQKDLGVREQFKSAQEVFDYLAPFLKTKNFKSLRELAKREFNSSTLLQH